MINYLDKLPLHIFYLKLYFTPLKMTIPVPLNYKKSLLDFTMYLYILDIIFIKKHFFFEIIYYIFIFFVEFYAL